MLEKVVRIDNIGRFRNYTANGDVFFRKRTTAGLQASRDFVIPDKREQATESSDFELITWLVIKSGKTDG